MDKMAGLAFAMGLDNATGTITRAVGTIGSAVIAILALAQD